MGGRYLSYCFASFYSCLSPASSFIFEDTSTFIGTCIISSQILNTNQAISSPIKKERGNMSLCHLIFIYVVRCRNCTTPIISLGHKKKNKKENIASSSYLDLCCAMA